MDGWGVTDATRRISQTAAATAESCCYREGKKEFRRQHQRERLAARRWWRRCGAWVGSALASVWGKGEGGALLCARFRLSGAQREGGRGRIAVRPLPFEWSTTGRGQGAHSCAPASVGVEHEER
eukprot:355489-Chlamydomonas_euryale.AAC.21